MNHPYLVSYDIADPKRLQRVYKVMRAHGEHLQYSVFYCNLPRSSKNELKAKLESLIDVHADQILFIPIRSRLHIESIGQSLSAPDQDLIWVTDSEADTADKSDTEG